MKQCLIVCALTILAAAFSGCPKPATPAAVTVTITAQGANSAGLLIASPHSDVTFVATVKDGTKPYSYQWYRDGVKIVGATLDHYIAANVSEKDTGFYECRVTDAAGAGTKSATEVSATNEQKK